MKKAIAMKCSQEDWDSIKPELTKYNLHFENIEEDWVEWCYLKNNSAYSKNKVFITNIPNNWKKNMKRKVYETFNAKIFLEACGIEFEKKFEITKKQIIEIASWGNSRDNEKVKEWFPEVFKNEFELNKWYKSTMHPKMMIYPTQIDKNNHLFGYGLDNFGKWIEIHIDSKNNCLCNSDAKEYLIEATAQEVEAALINEAKKRGFENGVYCNNSEIHGTKLHNNKLGNGYFKLEENCLSWYERDETWYCIFDNGKWAAIIETITIQEAEKLLNKKIV